MWGASTTAEELWSRDDVLSEVLVNVDEDSWVLSLIKLGSNHAGWLLRAAAGDNDVDALWVVLRAIPLTRGVKSNDFMSENILSSSNIVRNLDSPCVVTGNQVIGCPLARRSTPNLESSLTNLEKLQSGLVLVGTVTAGAGGKVIDDWTTVGLWPVGPLEVDGRAGGDWDGFAEWVGGAFVADDVGVAEGGWWDEAVVEVVWDSPAGDFWFWVGELEGWGVAWEAVPC